MPVYNINVDRELVQVSRRLRVECPLPEALFPLFPPKAAFERARCVYQWIACFEYIPHFVASLLVQTRVYE